jgi:hypothetical protein
MPSGVATVVAGDTGAVWIGGGVIGTGTGSDGAVGGIGAAGDGVRWALAAKGSQLRRATTAKIRSQPTTPVTWVRLINRELARRHTLVMCLNVSRSYSCALHNYFALRILTLLAWHEGCSASPRALLLYRLYIAARSMAA